MDEGKPERELKPGYGGPRVIASRACSECGSRTYEVVGVCVSGFPGGGVAPEEIHYEGCSRG